MPGRTPRGGDPFRNVHAWDDGYDYLHPASNGSGSYPSTPYASPPLPTSKQSRTAGYEPDRLPRPPLGRDSDSYRRSRPPSPPPPYSDPYVRPRRSRRDRSPPSHGPTRSPTPPRRRDDRRDRDARYPPSAARRPGPPMRHDTAPLPRTRRGESPPPRRRTYSPSPPPRQRTRARSRDRSRDRRPRATSPSDKRRPPVSRSKTTAGTTTTTPTGGSKSKSKFPTLGPRWQAAATAAFQAGAAAAMNSRSQPGAWTGQKGAKVATAALGAAAMDALAGKKKTGGEDKSRGGGGGRRKSGVENIGGALGGLLVDQLVRKASGKR